MAHQRSPRAGARITGRLRSVWRRERRERPVAYRLALVGVGALGLSAGLAAMQLGVMAQLIGGLALLPLALAAFLRLLPPPPWIDEGSDGWGRGQRTDRGGPWPPDEPELKFEWDEFEREFRAFVLDNVSGSRQ